MEASDPLRRYPLFSVLDPVAVADWLASGEVRPVELGETLFAAGTPGRHAFLVQSGRVRVLRTTKSGREVVMGTFGPGELFGEYALLAPGLNTATCRVATAGHVLQLPLDPLRAIVAAQPTVQAHLKRWLRLHGLLGHLRDQSFLGFMSASTLVPLLDRFETARFDAGQTIQADGLSDDGWFVVLRGEVRVDPGPPAPFGPGDCFGDGALLGRAGLPVAEARTECTCMVLRREAFYRSLEDRATPSVQTCASHPPAPLDSYPWVGQQEAVDCGVACLAMIARFHGNPVRLDALRSRVRLGPRGASLQELQQAANALGFRARAVQVGEEHLARVTLPAIAHLIDDHYVVAYALVLAGIVVGDPAAGVLTTRVPQFRKTWTGRLLLLTRGGR